jgi:hypothetical protein
MNIGNYVITITKRNSPKQIDELNRLNKLLQKQSSTLLSLRKDIDGFKTTIAERDTQINLFIKQSREEYRDAWKFTYDWRGTPKRTNMADLILQLVNLLGLEIIPDANNSILLGRKPTTAHSDQSTPTTALD